MQSPATCGKRAPSRVILCLLLLLGVTLVFGQTLGFAFLGYDDPEYVTANVHVRQGLDLHTFCWALGSTSTELWHPLTWLSHLLDVTVWGLAPLGHHLGNVVLHAASSVLLFLAFDGATKARWRSFLIAGLFALHPLRADSVAWVAERKDVLCTFLTVLTLFAYVCYARSPSRGRYVRVLVAFALSLLAKPTAIVFPLGLLLFDYWPLARFEPSQRPQRILEKVPLLALSVAGAIATMVAHARAIADLPLRVRLANAAVAYARQLGHIFFPRHLSIFYPHAYSGGAPLLPSHVAGGCVLLSLLGLVAWVCRERRPYVTFGVAWFVGLLLPVSGVLQSGSGAMADRFTYVPGIGVACALVFLVGERFEAWGVAMWARAVVSAGALLAYATAAFFEVSNYRDTRSVFAHAVDSTGANWEAEYRLGLECFGAGDLEGAMGHFVRETEIGPAPAQAPGFSGIGRTLEKLGRHEEALAALARAVELDPKAGVILDEYCTALMSNGRTEEGLACLRRALMLPPERSSCYANLGRALFATGDTPHALGAFEGALRLDPTDAQSRNDECVALLALGRDGEALQCLERAIALDPSAPLPYMNLATLYDRMGRPDLAESARREVVRRGSRSAP